MNTTTKKILHIITGLNDGGAEAVLYRLCATEKSNQHIVVSMMDGGKYKPLLEEKKISVYCLNMEQGKASIKSIVLLWKLIRSIKPDVVQTWMYHADLIGGLIAKLCGAKQICWGVHHSTLVKEKSKSSTIIIAKINSILSSFIPNKIIYCAQSARTIHEAAGYSKAKGIVINNGYDTAKFYPDNDLKITARRELGITEDIFLLGLVGRFNPLKDHKNLVDALGILTKTGIKFKCLLIGKDIDNDNPVISSWIEQQSINDKVVLLGQRSDIDKIMNALDINLLSSFGEAFPNVLAEAMACGTPCISTDVGDAAVIVDDTGWIVPAKSPTLLAQSITEAFNEMTNGNWNARKKRCRDRIVENFSIEKMNSCYLDAWNIKN